MANDFWGSFNAFSNPNDWQVNRDSNGNWTVNNPNLNQQLNAVPNNNGGNSNGYGSSNGGPANYREYLDGQKELQDYASQRQLSNSQDYARTMFGLEQSAAGTKFGYESSLQGQKIAGERDIAREQIQGNKDIAGIQAQASMYGAEKQYEAAVQSSNNNLQGTLAKVRGDTESARLAADANRYGSLMQYQGVLAQTEATRDAANIQAVATYAKIGSDERISAAQIAQAREQMQTNRELGLADIAQKYFGSASNMFSASLGGNSGIYAKFLDNARGF